MSAPLPTGAASLISVVLPVHNRGAQVARTIQSVLEQTHQQLELLVIDDGSTDDTRDIIEGFARRDARVRTLHHATASGGPAVPRNLGVSASSGELVAFIDHDDEWYPSKLQTQLEVLRASCADLVYSDCDVQLAGGPRKAYSELWRLESPQPLGGRGVAERLIEADFIPTLTVLATRAILARAGPFDASIEPFDDHDMWLRIACLGGSFAFVDQPTALYDWTGKNLSFSYSHADRAARRVVMFDRLGHDFPAYERPLDEAAQRWRTEFLLEFVRGRTRRLRPPWTAREMVQRAVTRRAMRGVARRTWTAAALRSRR